MNYETYEFDADEIEAAEQYAEQTARVDDRTKDPENVIANKAAARLSERAATAVLRRRGRSPVWVAEADTTGDEAPYDIEVAGMEIDVKCRRSADDGATANLMPTRDNLQRAGRTFDGWIMVWVAPDLSEARVYGGATVEYFRAENDVFYGMTPPRDRLKRDDLQPLAELLG